jgi:hypothetical protein
VRLILSRSAVDASPQLMKEFLRLVAADIDFLRATYPRFDEWLLHKVIPGIHLGERTAVIEQRDSVVAGLLIVKHSRVERKLCTLRVRPHFENKGLGVRMFEVAFELLGTDRPLLSVSETSKPKFSRLFAHFGFAQEAVYRGRYLPKVDELSYNGLLDVPQLEGKELALQIGCSSLRNHALHNARFLSTDGALLNRPGNPGGSFG